MKKNFLKKQDFLLKILSLALSIVLWAVVMDVDNPERNMRFDDVPVRILDDGMKVNGIVLRDVDSGDEQTLEVSGIFPYIGQDPAVSFLQGLDVLDEKGYMIVDANGETACKGI